MDRVRERIHLGQRAQAASLAALSALALLVAAASAFRLQPAEALGFGLSISGPRLLLGAAVGAALAASAWLAQRRGCDLVRRELWLFGASAGGAFGAALWSSRIGAASSLLGALLGAALLAAVLDRVHRLARAYLFLLGLSHAAAWYLCLYGTTYARGSLDGARARLAWWGGDLSHATWPGAIALAGAVLAVLCIATPRTAGARAATRTALEIALLGLAIGAAGPIAFVGLSGAGLASLAAKELDAKVQLGLAALAGAGALALADSLQRQWLGGYAFAPSVVTSFVAFPLLYLACARARQRREARSRRWLSVIESTVVLGASAIGYYVVFRIAALVHALA